MTAKGIVKWKGKNLHNINKFYYIVKNPLCVFHILISMDKDYGVSYIGYMGEEGKVGYQKLYIGK